MAVSIDKKKSSRISYGKNGFRVERTAIVSNVTGNAENLLYRAITDSSLPQYGDPHPTVPGIALKNITADPLGLSLIHI